MGLENSNPNNNPVEKPNSLDIKKEDYLDLINDFGYFITLNASKLDQYIFPGKENDLKELMQVLRKPIINGMNYPDFTSNNFNKIYDPEVGKALIKKIYEFIQYIEPRLVIFKEGTPWVARFEVIKQKYINLVTVK